MSHTSDHELEDGLEKLKEQMKDVPEGSESVTDVLATKDNTDELPMFMASNSYESMMRATNNSKDINFTMDLSENLLMECRRLQAMNEKFKKKIEQLKQENHDLVEDQQKHTTGTEKLQQELDDLKHLNWDLEANMDSCNNALRLIRNEKNDLDENYKTTREQLDAIRTESEVLKLENQKLQSQLSSHVANIDQESKSMRQRLSNLNDENDELSSKVNSLETSLSTLKNGLLRFLKKQKLVEEDTSDLEDDFFDTRSIDTMATEINNDLPIEKLETMAQSHNCKLIPIDQDTESYKLNSLSLESIINKINDSEDFEVISRKELETLREQVKNPEITIERVKDSLSSDNKDQQIKLMKWIAQLNSRIILTEDKYNEMNNRIFNPNRAQLSETAEKIGLNVIEKNDLENLKEKALNPSVDLIKIFARNNNMTAIPTERYEMLESSYNTPTKEFLEERANDLNHTLIDKKSLNDMRESIENPDISFIKEAAKKFNEKIISTAEYEEMMRCLENPSLEFLTSKAEQMKQKIIPAEVFEDLENTSKHPSMEFLNQKAFEAGYKVVSVSDYDQLKRSVEQPSLDFITEKAEDYDQRLISSDEFEELMQISQDPPIDFLSARASAKGYEMLKTKQYDDLLRKTNEPTAKELAAIASGVGYVAIPDSEYLTLKEISENPSMGILREKAEAYNHVVIDKNEYEDMKMKSNDKNAAIENIASFGFKAVPLSEYNELIDSTLENSSLEDLRKRLDSEGYVMVERDIYNKLSLPVFERGSLDDTMKLCEKFSLRAVSKEEFEELEKSASSPVLSIDELIERVKSHGFMVHSLEEHKELQKKFEEPDINYLIEKAQKYNVVLIDSNENSRNEELIKNTPLSFVREKAALHDCSIIETKKLEEMQTQIEQPTIEMLKETAEKIDCIVMTSEEKTKLDEHMAKPPLDYLKEKARRQRKELVDLVEFRELIRKTTNPTGDEIKQYANSLQSVVLLNDEYNDLQKQIEYPTLDYLVSSLEKFNYVAIPKEEYEHSVDRYNNPSNDYLSEKLADNGMIMVNNNEYQNLLLSVDNPELAYLEEKAKAFRKIVIDKEEFQYKLDIFENPSLEFLESKANNINKQIIDKDELNDLRDKLRNPTEDYLIEHAELQNKTLVDKTDYQCKLRQLENPTIDFLRNMARKESMVLMAKNEAETMQAMLSQPDLDYLKASAKELGYEIVELARYRELVNNSETPSFEFLQSKIHSMNYVIVRQEKWESVKQKAENPTEEELKSYAHNYNLKVFTSDELNDFIAQIKLQERNNTSPSSKVKASKQYFEQLIKEQKQQPGKIKEHAQALGFVTLPTDEYENLIKNQKDSALKKEEIYRAAREMNMTVIDKESYSKFIQQRSSPVKLTYEELQSLATKMDMDLIKRTPDLRSNSSGTRLNFVEKEESAEDSSSSSTREKSENLTQNKSPFLTSNTSSLTLEELTNKAKELGYILSPMRKSASPLSDIPDLTSESTATNSTLTNTHENHSSLDLSKITQDNHKTQSKTIPNKLDINTVQELLKETEYELINKKQLKELKSVRKPSKPTKPTEKELQKIASTLGLSLLTQEQLKDLEDPAKLSDDDLKKEASKRSLIVLSLKSYKALLSKERQASQLIPKITRLEIVKKAPVHGLIAIDQREYNSLKTDNKKIDIGKVDENMLRTRAKELGLVVMDKNDASHMERVSKPKTKLELIKLLQIRYNLVAIPRAEYSKLKSQITNAKSTESPSSTAEIETNAKSSNITDVEQMKQELSSQGFLVVPSTCFISTAYAKTPTTKKVVVLPRMYYMTLLARSNPRPIKRTTLSSRNNTSNLDSTLVSEASELPLKSKTAPSSPASEVPPNTISSALYGGTSFNETISSTVKSESTPLSFSPTQSPLHTPSKRTAKKPPMNRSTSVDTLGTLNSIASMNEKTMIPALTQTVIGEYLYKYYPKLGHIGGEGRHRRYFWIHPYSMTLYWSETNPVMENAAQSKTKGVSILNVSVIPDNSSHPSGLYYKSIVVTTDDRNVIFTCPTRERHMVWYNSLRYLLQRSIDGIPYDEIVEDSDNDMYAGKVFPLGRQGQHVPGRLGTRTTMRSPSISSLRDRVKK